MLSESVEDYLESIYSIQRLKGYARTSDIKKLMKHSAASVTEMFQKLDRMGYVHYEKYGGVTLTEKGKEVAAAVSERHRVLKDFLKILGISEEIAQNDACRIEHNVHEKTMELLTKFVEFVQATPDNPRWLEHFKIFRDTGDLTQCIDCHVITKSESQEPKEDNQ